MAVGRRGTDKRPRIPVQRDLQQPCHPEIRRQHSDRERHPGTDGRRKAFRPPAPSGRRRAAYHFLRRQYASRPPRRSGQDAGNGSGGYEAEGARHCEQTDVRRAEVPCRTVGQGVHELLPCRENPCGRAERLHTGLPQDLRQPDSHREL